jgi:hypothetical protein
MPKKTKPKAVCDRDTPLTPITAKERRKLDESIKKKYDRFRRRYPEVHGKVVDFITHSIEDGTFYFSVRFKDKTDFLSLDEGVTRLCNWPELRSKSVLLTTPRPLVQSWIAVRILSTQ